MSLRAHAASRVDKKYGDIAVRCSHRHVARVLLMPRRIRDQDSTAVREVHVPVGDVDRDALLTLGLEPIGEK